MCPECPPDMKPEEPAPGSKCTVGCKCVPVGPVAPLIPVMCPQFHCPGRVGKCFKIAGCDFCNCLPPCPPISKLIDCPQPCSADVVVKGCTICLCGPPRFLLCPLRLCKLKCSYGFEQDNQGCSTCKCKPRRPIEIRPDQIGAPGTK